MTTHLRVQHYPFEQLAKVMQRCPVNETVKTGRVVIAANIEAVLVQYFAEIGQASLLGSKLCDAEEVDVSTPCTRRKNENWDFLILHGGLTGGSRNKPETTMREEALVD